MNPFWRKEVLESRIVSDFLLFAICGHLPALEMYLLFYFSRFTVTSWRRICICFSPFSDLQSLLDAKNVSAFLLFAICSHFSPPEVYPIFSFSWFTVTLENWELSFFLLFPICSHYGNPGVYLFFSFLAICGHFRIHECICILLFCNLQSLLVPGIVSYFLLLVICSHILTPEMHLHFSFLRFAVTYRCQKAMSKAWWVTKKTQQKTIFSPDAAGFLDSKKDSGISCLFWRRYFFLWGVAKTI